MIKLSKKEINKLKLLSDEDFHSAQDEMFDIINTLINESKQLFEYFQSKQNEIHDCENIVEFAQWLLTFDDEVAVIVDKFTELPDLIIEEGIGQYV